jgi:hypothetical protein
MAIIDNEIPTAEQPSVSPGSRVVVKLRATLPPNVTATADAARQTAMQGLLEGLSGATVRPYFEDLGPPPPVGGTVAAAASQPVFNSYFVVEPPPGVPPVDVARQLTARPDVEIAYVEGGPTPPPVNPPGNNPLAANQGYHAAAPVGIDAYWAWAHTDGTGINFVDLEQGWTLNHEDLVAAGVALISGVNRSYPGHGTAVLGEVVGVDNPIGIVGIAPSARARVVSQWRPSGSYGTADAIRSAMSAMRAGDVLLLEAQTTYPPRPPTDLLPVEVEQAVYDAIRAATDAGIVVVEAGGNGSVDLDKFQDLTGRFILNRSSSHFQDSGAIMVGASSSAVPHSRMGFSNFGSRIDCYAWGENIQSTGDGWTGNLTATYTRTFGGTSGASPIVTGAAILLQAWSMARHSSYVPHTLRALLSDPALNTPSANPAVDRIGVMPNLKAVIGHELAPPVASITRTPLGAGATV